MTTSEPFSHRASPTEVVSESGTQWPYLLRWMAQSISILFHPLWIPFAVSEFLLWVHRYELPQINDYFHFRVMSSIAVNTLILPLGTIVLLKAVGFVQSVQLHTRQERIVPYMAVMIYYWWIYRAFAYDKNFPQVLTPFLLGNFITIILVFLCNIFFKISAHAAAMGSVVAVMILLGQDPYLNPTLPILVAILLSGIVLTSRLIVDAHFPMEVYTGFVVGFMSQILAMIWIRL
ncbi:MAG: phosphatase PAP2 family protein [Thermoflavifilum sp.]|nr:phosphatase PAP2 family protein [Thermoflavifilum sp.]